MNDPRLTIRIAGDLTAIRAALSQLQKDVGGLGGKLAKSSEQGTRALNRMESAATSLRNTIRTVATSFVALQSFRLSVGLADEFQQITGVLRLATNSTEDLAAAQKGVFEVAQDTRAPLRETANTYGTLERTTRNLGLSQAELLRTLETVNKSIGLTPVSVQSAQAALVQFGQALAGDFKAGAQEINSILEQTPGLAISIAKGLGVQTSELKRMGEQGKLSAELVVRGLLRISEEVDAEFQKVPKTVSGALTQIRNQFVQSLGSQTNVQPLIDGLGELQKTLADPAVAQGLAGLASAILKLAAAIAEKGAGIVNFFKFIGEEFAVGVEPAFDDLVRTSDKIIQLRERLKELQSPVRQFFVVTDPAEIKEVADQIKRLEAQYEAASKAAEQAAIAGERKKKVDAEAAAEAKKKAAADFAAAEAEREKKAREDEVRKEAEKRQKQVRDTIRDLETEAATYGLAADQVVAYKLALLGASDAQIQQGVAAARRLQQLKDEEQLQKDLTKAAIERAEAEEKLAEDLADVRARLAGAGGDDFAVQRRALERQRDELLRKIDEVNPNDTQAKGLVHRLFNVELAQARAASIEQQAQALLNRLRQMEDNFALQDQAGAPGFLEREQHLAELRRKTITELEELRQKLVEVLQTEQDVATRNAAADALAQLDGEILRVKASAEVIKNDVRDLGQQSLENFFTSIATGANSARDALKQLVVDFVQGLARMAAQALAKKAALAIFGGNGGFLSSVFHGGGVAGRGGTKRRVPASLAPLFAIAPRYHSGGVAGLKPNEVPAILERGERVLTENQSDALAQQQRPGPGFRVVNVFDPSFVPDQMDSALGERVIMNIIGRNPGRVRQLLGPG